MGIRNCLEKLFLPLPYVFLHLFYLPLSVYSPFTPSLVLFLLRTLLFAASNRLVGAMALNKSLYTLYAELHASLFLHLTMGNKHFFDPTVGQHTTYLWAVAWSQAAQSAFSWSFSQLSIGFVVQQIRGDFCRLSWGRRPIDSSYQLKKYICKTAIVPPTKWLTESAKLIDG